MALATLFLSCYAATTATVMGLAIRSAPQKTEASSALNFLSTGLGFMIGPAVVGYVSEKDGLPAGWCSTFIPAATTPIFISAVALIERGSVKLCCLNDEDAQGNVETSLLSPETPQLS